MSAVRRVCRRGAEMAEVPKDGVYVTARNLDVPGGGLAEAGHLVVMIVIDGKATVFSGFRNSVVEDRGGRYADRPGDSLSVSIGPLDGSPDAAFAEQLFENAQSVCKAECDPKEVLKTVTEEANKLHEAGHPYDAAKGPNSNTIAMKLLEAIGNLSSDETNELLETIKLDGSGYLAGLFGIDSVFPGAEYQITKLQEIISSGSFPLEGEPVSSKVPPQDFAEESGLLVGEGITVDDRAPKIENDDNVAQWTKDGRTFRLYRTKRTDGMVTGYAVIRTDPAGGDGNTENLEVKFDRNRIPKSFSTWIKDDDGDKMEYKFDAASGRLLRDMFAELDSDIGQGVKLQLIRDGSFTDRLRIGETDVEFDKLTGTATLTEDGERKVYQLEPGLLEKSGSKIGSFIGRYLAETKTEQIVYGTVLGTFLGNMGEEIGYVVKGSDELDAWGDFGADLKNAAVGSISSFLVAEIQDALGIRGVVAGGLFSSLVQPMTNVVVQNLLNVGKAQNIVDVYADLGRTKLFSTDASDLALDAFSLSNFLGSIAVSIAANVVVSKFSFINTKEEALVSQIGGTLGGGIGSTFGPFGSALGTIIGSAVGAILGGLFVDDETVHHYIANLDEDSSLSSRFRVYDTLADGKPEGELRGHADGIAGVLTMIAEALGGDPGQRIDTGFGFHSDKDGSDYLGGRDFREFRQDSGAAYAYAVTSALEQMKRPGALLGVDPLSWKVFSDWDYDLGNPDSVTALVSDLDVARQFLLYVANHDEITETMELIMPGSSVDSSSQVAADAGRQRGTVAADLLEGKAGSVADSFDADAGGDDTLSGGLGDDTYYLGLNTGADTIDEGQSGGGRDRILVEPVAGADGVELERDGDDLIVRLYVDGSTLRVLGHFVKGSAGRVEKLEFARGGTLNLAGLVLADKAKALVSDLMAVRGTNGADTLRGTVGQDVFDSSGDGDILRGGGGDDIYYLRSGTGDDTVDEDRKGGGGKDRILVGAGVSGADVRLSRKGDDLLVALLDKDGKESDTLRVKGHFKEDGRGFVEELFFAGGENYLLGRLDVPDGGSALASSLALSKVEQSFVLGWAAVLSRATRLGLDAALLKNAGVLGTDAGDRWQGGEGRDLYLGVGGDDTLHGGGGKDRLYGGVGDDVLSGGEGDDMVHGGSGDDEIAGGEGGDRLYGDSGADIVRGGKGDDHLTGGDGADELYGGAGDDTIEADEADSVLAGGSGRDTLITNARQGMSVDLSRGTYRTRDAAASSGLVVGIENVVGSQHADLLVGDSHDNTLTGLAGDDHLEGRGGDDTYVFGYHAGHDLLTERADGGVDTLKFVSGESQREFGPQDIALRFEGGQLVIALQDYLSKWVNGEFNLDWVYRNAEHKRWAFDLLSDKVTVKDWDSGQRPVERFMFGDVTYTWDELIGLAADAQFIGSSEDEVLVGRHGARYVEMEAARRFWRRGTSDDDVLAGGSGMDVFHADAGGSDTLRGGAGSDLYYLGPRTERDVIDEDEEGAGGEDRIRVVSGWSADNVRLKREGNDLVVLLLGRSGTGLDDSLRVRNHFSSLNNRARVETLEFESGGYYELSELNLQAGADVLASRLTRLAPLEDTLEGAGGDDTLKGGGGKDVYVFNLGDGRDVVLDERLENGVAVDAGLDTLLFGSGIALTDLVLRYDGTDLQVAIKEDGVTDFDLLADRVTLRKWSDALRRVEYLALRDGTRILLSEALTAYGVGSSGVAVWLNAAMASAGYAAGTSILGTEGDDVLVAGEGIDRLSGGKGDDSLRISSGFSSGLKLVGGDGLDTVDFGFLSGLGGQELRGVAADLSAGTWAASWAGGLSRAGELSGIERLKGTKGADSLTGSSGGDRLRGGGGDDTLSGGSGNDIYEFSLWDGNDRIRDSGGHDVLLFDETVHVWDLWLGYGKNGDLVIKVRDSWNASGQDYDQLDQSIVLVGWEDGASDAVIDEVRFSDNVLYRLSRRESNPLKRFGRESSLLMSGSSARQADSLHLNSLVKWAMRHGLKKDAPLRLGNVALMAELLSVVSLPPDLKLPPDSDPRSPLVLDLDGDGVETTAKAVFFDHDGDGFSEWTAMSGADDALLAIDLDGSGDIEDGRELFGTGMAIGGRKARHGFEALSRLDSNGDGVVDHRDSRWNDLRLLQWADLDNDGFLETKRLLTLSEAGVLSLNLGFSRSSHVDGHGNEHRFVGSYRSSLGVRQTADVWFAVDTEHAKQAVPASLSLEISSLPYLAGSGKVTSLHVAMEKDSDLKELVKQFGSDAMRSGGATREDLLNRILYRWTGATDVTPREVGAIFNKLDTRWQYVVESFVGRKWLENSGYRRPNYTTAQKIQQTWYEIREWVGAGLMIQTHLSDLWTSIRIETEKDGSIRRFDFGGALALLEREKGARLADFVRALTVFSRTQPMLAQSLSADSSLSYGYRYYADQLGLRVFERVHQDSKGKLSENGAVYGWDADTHLDDVLIGNGRGTDTLYGADGNDIYLLEYGIGHDVINEARGNRTNTFDVIRVAPGVSPDLVTVARSGRDLLVSLRATVGGSVTDTLRVKNHFSGNSVYRIEQVVFGDGTVWGDVWFANLSAIAVSDTVGDDTLDGSPDSDIFDADEGGNDRLRGRGGSDRYVLGAGTGHDIVEEGYLNMRGDRDLVVLKADVRLSSLRLERTRTDLVISLVNGNQKTDSLTIKDYYVSEQARVEEIYSHLGRLLFRTGEFDVLQLHDAGDGNTDGIVEGLDRFADHMAQEAGNQVLRGGGGDDVYHFGFGAGKDTIEDALGFSTVRLDTNTRKVLLVRSHGDLFVQLVDSEGREADRLKIAGYFLREPALKLRFADGTEWGEEEFALARLVDDVDGDATVEGLDGWVKDYFADQAGSQVLRGGWGNDWYYVGTGSDVIEELDNGYWGDANDRVFVDRHDSDSAVLSRTRNDLTVSFVDSDGIPTGDSVTVRNYFRGISAQIEGIRFADGVSWGATEFAKVELVDDGDTDASTVRGSSYFDDLLGMAAGSQTLQGGGGDDTYQLGLLSGHDIIDEAAGNTNSGDSGDEIHIEAGIAPSSVHLFRSGDGLLVEVDGESDAAVSSLLIRGHFRDAKAQIERIVFSNGETLDSEDFEDLDQLWKREAGAQTMYGGAGVDIYELGAGSGSDVVDEEYRNSRSNGGLDVIRIVGLDISRIRLRRTRWDLVIEVLDGGSVVTDSLTVRNQYRNAVSQVEQIKFSDGTVWGLDWLTKVVLEDAGSGDDVVRGLGNGFSDILDGSRGGNDILRGMSGDDVYLFGSGSGHDVVEEAHGNAFGGDDGDVVRMKAGIRPNRLRLSREGNDLVISLLARGSVTDSLTVRGHYSAVASRIEGIEFSDGTVWGPDRFGKLVQKDAGSGDDVVRGLGNGFSDILDGSRGGNDILRGMSGDDVYLFGSGSGHDVVEEAHGNAFGGDDGDVVRMKAGIRPNRLRLSREGNDLVISLLAKGSVTDSLTVRGHYSAVASRIEGIEFSNGTVWGPDRFGKLVQKDAGSGDDVVRGLGNGFSDILDGSRGGNDILRGMSGDDVYLFGSGSGHDVVEEAHGNAFGGDDGDVVRMKAGIKRNRLRLSRTANDLIISLRNADDTVTDSLTIRNHYAYGWARVETVLWHDGTVLWSESHLAAAAWTAPAWKKSATTIRGGTSSESLYGANHLSDIFDSNAGGNDVLYGYGGDDVYWLGRGTGLDVVREDQRHVSDDGDAGDEVRLKAGIGTGDIRLWRDRRHLYIGVLTEGKVSDRLQIYNYYTDGKSRVERLLFADGTEWGASEFMRARLRGGSGADQLYGLDHQSDIFDSDAGGNDGLYGYGGDDVYWLGRGTGLDVVREDQRHVSDGGDAGDEVRLKAGIGTGDIRLWRDRRHLYIGVLTEGKVSDRLQIYNYYTDGKGRVERLLFADGTEWGASEFMRARLRGGSGADQLQGLDHQSDIFDSDAGGGDVLYGYGGDDVYWLGRGTGLDVVREDQRHVSDGGDAGDEVRLKAGIGTGDIRLWRDTTHLYIGVLTEGKVSDRLQIYNYYTDVKGRVERLLFADGTEWGASEFMRARLRGGSGADQLQGLGHQSDIFDSDAGGNDVLYGYGGDDVYWLGRGTGLDVVREDQRHVSDGGDAGDEVRLKAGIGTGDIHLWRDTTHLYIGVLTEGKVSDRLQIYNYYTDVKGRVERLLFADGTEWGASEFMRARLRGGSGADQLQGLGHQSDIFDSDAGGNDVLYGYGGDDVYWLGRGTGLDVVREDQRHVSDDGDADDEVRLKAGIGTGDIRLWRDTTHLYIGVLTEGKVSDRLQIYNYYTDGKGRVERLLFADGTEWGASEFMRVRLRGGSGADQLQGLDHQSDIFDSDAGGNDVLYGYGGDDVYWLGRRTGLDVVREDQRHVSDGGDAGDEVRLKAGIGTGDIRLWRDTTHLYIGVLTEGKVSDRLQIYNYYTDGKGRVERLLFADGTEWGASEFMRVRLRGGSGDDQLYGLDHQSDIFDSDAGGGDILYGYGGDDVYWLGRGTGLDVVREDQRHVSDGGDAGDEVRLKAGIGTGDIRLWRDTTHLYIGVLTEGKVSDRLQIYNYYTDGKSRVERLLFADGTEWMLWERTGVLLPSSSSSTLEGDMGANVLRGRNKTVLHGKGGDDIYELGLGTGSATIDERIGNTGDGDAADRIRIDSGLGVEDVELIRTRDDLYVNLLGKANADGVRSVTDSLKVLGFFVSVQAQVEFIAFFDGTVWNRGHLMAAEIRASVVAGTVLDGLESFGDVFGSDSGAQILRGKTGDDVYLFGLGGGADVVDEAYGNEGLGDDGDRIRLAKGLKADDVRLRRDARHLYVKLVNAEGRATGDVLTVKNFFVSAVSQIEWVELFNGEVLWSDEDFTKAARNYDTSGSPIVGTSEDDTYDLTDAGTSEIHGGEGDDRYVFGYGAGRDRILESSSTADLGGIWDVIALKEGIGTGDVELVRTGNDLMFVLLASGGGDRTGDTLTVKDYFLLEERRIEALIFSDGTHWDWDTFALAAIRGTSGNDVLTGLDGVDDVFELGAGRDVLRGGTGNDVYRLDSNGGHGSIEEGHARTDVGDPRDQILVAGGEESARLYVEGDDLRLALVGKSGQVLSSLLIKGQFGSSSVSKVESVEFGSGAVWELDLLDTVLVSTAGAGTYNGRAHFSDVFGVGVGDAVLRGGSGNDVYMLGYGSGNDRVDEAYGNLGDGSGGDVIRLDTGIMLANVRLEKSGNDLMIRLLNGQGQSSDSIRVSGHFSGGSSRMESIETDTHVLLAKDFQALIDEMAAFNGGTSAFKSADEVRARYWDEIDYFTSPTA